MELKVRLVMTEHKELQELRVQLAQMAHKAQSAMTEHKVQTD
jgi:hypothetical protein